MPGSFWHLRAGDRPRGRHPGADRLRGPLPLRGHRPRGEPGCTPLRPGRAGADPDQPGGVRGRGRFGGGRTPGRTEPEGLPSPRARVQRAAAEGGRVVMRAQAWPAAELGISREMLTGPDLIPCQALAARLRSAGAEGILTLSSADPEGKNLVVFLDRLGPSSSVGPPVAAGSERERGTS